MSHVRQEVLGSSTAHPAGVSERTDYAPGGPVPSATDLRWTAAPRPARPLVVALVSNQELVTAGLPQMLTPYAKRVTVLDPAAKPARQKADLVLLDPCVRVAGEADAAVVVAGAALGRGLVIYTWARSSNLGGLGRLRAAGWPIRGWLSKSLPADDLVRALERIWAGQLVVLDEAPSGRHRPYVVPAMLPGSCQLTVRESEVVSMIAQGMSNQEIADAIFLSINSVKSYIRASYRKMGVTSRTQAVLWSVRNGLDIVPWQIVQGLSRPAATEPGHRPAQRLVGLSEPDRDPVSWTSERGFPGSSPA